MRSFGQTARHQDSRTRSNAESQTRRLLWLRHDLAAGVRAILRPNAVSRRAAWPRDERRVRELFRDRVVNSRALFRLIDFSFSSLSSSLSSVAASALVYHKG